MRLREKLERPDVVKRGLHRKIEDRVVLYDKKAMSLLQVAWTWSSKCKTKGLSVLLGLNSPCLVEEEIILKVGSIT